MVLTVDIVACPDLGITRFPWCRCQTNVPLFDLGMQVPGAET